MSHSARKAAWSKVDDTCPYVDTAFDDLYRGLIRLSPEAISSGEIQKLLDVCIERVKEQTCKLRDALIEAYEEMEAEIEELEYNHAEEITKLEKQLGEYQ